MKNWIKQNITEIVSVLIILAFVIFCNVIVSSARSTQEQLTTDTYNAWVKLTDNPKHLTRGEWILLKRSNCLAPIPETEK